MFQPIAKIILSSRIVFKSFRTITAEILTIVDFVVDLVISQNIVNQFLILTNNSFFFLIRDKNKIF